MVNETALSTNSHVVASSRQISCDVADEAVLLSMRSGEYYGLNAVGASIWHLIQQPRSVAEIRDALLKSYDVEPAECEVEIRAFIGELLALDLVEIRPEG